MKLAILTPTPVLQQRLADIDRQLDVLQRTRAHVAGILDARGIADRAEAARERRPRPAPAKIAPADIDNGLGDPVLPDPMPAWAVVAHGNRVALDTLGKHVRHADVAQVVGAARAAA